MRRRLVGLMVIGGLALGACGGDDDDAGGDVSEEEQPYVDAIVAQFQSGDETELQLTSEQAECVAPVWVDTIGVERLEEQGVTPEDITDETEDELPELGLDEAEGNALYDAFGDCDVDVATLFAESMAADSDLSEEDRECISEAFDDDLLRGLMVATITQGEDALNQDSELAGRLTEAVSACPGAGG